MKIAFILPWFGDYCVGGAEQEAKNTATHLQDSGYEVEILTTCLKDSHANWNDNYYRLGGTLEAGLRVRRFPVKKGLHEKFNKVLKRIRLGMELTPAEEKIFRDENVRSLELNHFIKEKAADYDFFIFIPYLYGTTIDSAGLAPEKSLLIPCLHNENFSRLKIFKEIFHKFKKIVFHTLAEKKLAASLYGLADCQGIVLGEGVDADLKFEKSFFRKKHHLKNPYLLFVGRKDEGKNLPLVLNYFENYKKVFKSDLKLVLIGLGKAAIPPSLKNEIIDLGFIPEKEKLAAYADALATVQPSLNESFSLVIMESWLAGVPVLVNGFCEVTRDHCLAANGGLCFENFLEFSEGVNWFLANQEGRQKMGQNGRRYVAENFAWPKIMGKYQKLFRELE